MGTMTWRVDGVSGNAARIPIQLILNPCMSRSMTVRTRGFDDGGGMLAKMDLLRMDLTKESRSVL